MNAAPSKFSGVPEVSVPTIVYIAGYGRSGSTLLERVLGSNGRMVAVGEVAQLGETLTDPQSLCSCGRGIRRCHFWSGVLSDPDTVPPVPSHADAGRKAFESLPGLLRLVRGRQSGTAEAYGRYNRTLFERIATNRDHADFVIDSSKTALGTILRPIALSRVAKLNVKVVHLVRDGRGCMWSYMKGSNRRMEKGEDPKVPVAALRSVVGWVLANLGAHLFQVMSPPSDYCRVRYEDFVDFPEQVLSSLGEFLGVSFDEEVKLLTDAGSVPLGHQLAGNRVRSRTTIVLRKDIEWHGALPPRHRLLFGLIGWPLALLYRYRLK